MSALLVAAAVLGVHTAGVQGDQLLCEGRARGPRSALVVVHFYVDPNGAVIARSVGWRPPVPARKISRKPLSALDLTIFYDHAERTGLGAPTGADASVLSSDGLGFLDNSFVVFATDGAEWARNFDVRAAAGGVHYRAANLVGGAGDRPLLGRIAGARTGHLSLWNARGEELASIVYDISARKERNRLFRVAWERAEQALAQPAKCRKSDPAAGVSSIASR